jgi:VanZ family protein
MLFLAFWIFAATTEIAQGKVGRAPSLADWAADMAGAITGLVAGGFALRLLLAGRLPTSMPAAPVPPRTRARSKAARR